MSGQFYINIIGFDLTSINIDGLLVNFDVLPDVILVKTCPKEKKSKLKLKRLDFEPLHQDNRHKGKTGIYFYDCKRKRQQ
jgi:hypothetical protein